MPLRKTLYFMQCAAHFSQIEPPLFRFVLEFASFVLSSSLFLPFLFPLPRRALYVPLFSFISLPSLISCNSAICLSGVFPPILSYMYSVPKGAAAKLFLFVLVPLLKDLVESLLAITGPAPSFGETVQLTISRRNVYQLAVPRTVLFAIKQHHVLPCRVYESMSIYKPTRSASPRLASPLLARILFPARPRNLPEERHI